MTQPAWSDEYGKTMPLLMIDMSTSINKADTDAIEIAIRSNGLYFKQNGTLPYLIWDTSPSAVRFWDGTRNISFNFVPHGGTEADKVLKTVQTNLHSCSGLVLFIDDDKIGSRKDYEKQLIGILDRNIPVYVIVVRVDSMTKTSAEKVYKEINWVSYHAGIAERTNYRVTSFSFSHEGGPLLKEALQWVRESAPGCIG